jgi:hypothetical protein
MKNELLLAGITLTIGLLLLFVGCNTSSNDNGQGAGEKEIQQPAQGAGPQAGNPNPGTQEQQPRLQSGQANLGVEACSGKSEKDTCILNFRNQSVNGTCTNRDGNMTCMPDDNSIVQRPSAMPGGEAFLQACSGKAAGDTCALTMRNQSIDGTCADRNGNLTCNPNNRNTGQRPDNPGR